MKLATNQEVIELLREIKSLWDTSGFGEDEEQSERLYHKLASIISAHNQRQRRKRAHGSHQSENR